MLKRLIKNMFCAAAGIAAIPAANASAAPEDNSYVWDDIETFRINKEPPRAFFTVCENFAAAIKPISADGLFSIYTPASYKILNGEWKFFFAESPGQIKREFFLPNFDDSAWSIIDVPNSWQCAGFDRIFYCNNPAEFQFDLEGRRIKGYDDGSLDNPPESVLNPRIPEIHRREAVYRRSFTLPESWAGKEIYIRFNGVSMGFNLFINGQKIGYSEDSFTPAEFDISKYLRAGKNSIAVEVFKTPTGAYFEMQDMPHMAGIIRDVMLIARSKLHLRDYFARASFSEGLKSAAIDISAEIVNTSASPSDEAVLEAFLTDESGAVFGGGALFKKRLGAIGAGQSVKVQAAAGVKSFKLWSPDKPNLYGIVFKLSNADGTEIESVRADFAFRKFEISGRDIKLNNSPLFLIKGANRHDWSPDKGKACSLKWMKLDVELMKRANVNAVRTSHYPNDDLFYMLCSRYGIMVLDECNQEQHGYRNTGPLDFDKFIPASVDRMKNMVLRDRNVPCVFAFSLGNESAGRVVKGHGDMARVVREFAPLHFVHSEAEVSQKMSGKGGFSDFASPMYGGVDRMKAYLNSESTKCPFFFCEYAHAMGNSIGNLKGKWDLIRAHPDRLHGGFIWDWVDQALYLPREGDPSKLYLSDGRDWKTSPSANNFCQNGIVFADRSYSAKYYEVRKVYQDLQISQARNYEDGAGSVDVKISNEFFDTDLNELSGEISVSKDGVEIAKAKLPVLDLPAGKSAEFSLPLPKADMSGAGEYACLISFKRKNPAAFESKSEAAASGQIYLKKVADSRKPQPIRGGFVSAGETAGTLLVKAGKAEILFNKKSAELESLKFGGKPILTSPLRFDISSAFIDNEAFGGACARAEKNFGLDRLKEFGAEIRTEILGKNALRVFCKKRFANPDGMGFAAEFVYTVLPDAKIIADVSVRKLNDTPRELDLPRISATMGLSPKLSEIEYFGRGPFANYCDRLSAAYLGRYRAGVSEFFEPFTRPQDTGNREEVRWLRAGNSKGEGVLIRSLKGNLSMAVLPYTQAQLKAAKHPHNLPEPSQTELRVSPFARGLGNASCGPQTREKFRHYFKGGVSWSFEICPFSSFSEKVLGNLLRPIDSSYFYEFPPAPENLRDESVFKPFKGSLVSGNAKVSYSSVDPQWSPKRDTLLAGGGGAFAFHTKKEANPFLILELAGPFNITGVEILNRSDDQGSRTSPLAMYFSEDGETWSRVWGSSKCLPRWRILFENPKRAKFVKIVLEKTEFFHLKGLKVYGEQGAF
ncbi:MAG: discoidin domain-containing protein [Opitutales bacterium]|nr:discoidin domain-containing protein [Opitutales bacterium]